MALVIIALVLLLAVGWVYMSLTIVQPDQIGIKVFLGNPGNTVDSGLRFTWWPLQRLELYSKGLMEFNFNLRSVMTKKGKVRGETSEIQPVELNLNCTLYARFDQNRLGDAVRYGPGSREEDLGPLLVPYVMGILRSLIGRVPWKLINQERRYVAEWVVARLVPTNGYFPLIDDENDPPIRFDTDSNNCRHIGEADLQSSPFVMSGLTKVSLAIKDVDFVDPELKKSVTAAERARQDAEATRTTAYATRDKSKAEGEGVAEARRMMIEVIKQNPDLEALLTLREMAQGTANTIFYQLPGMFEKRVQEILGGNDINDVLRALRPEDRKAILKAIDDATRGKK